MDKIFLEIFNTSLTAGWIVLAVLVLRLLLKKAPRAYTCALWGIVGLRLVWPFSIESGLSLIPSPEVIPQSQLYDATPQVQTGIPSLNSAVNPVFSQTFAPEVGASVNPLQVVLSVAGWAWVIGMAAMVIYSLVSYLRLRRQVCAAVRQEGNVYLCDDVASPFILGIFRPKIYLPSDMPQEQIACVLAHERAHLKRKDHWLKPLGFALLTVHWFHPLLWLAYILLCRDIEFACDEKVIADMDAEEKAHYSETLLACSISHKHIAACPLAFGETGVKGRIQSVLNYKKPAVWVTVVSVILCVAFAACSLTEPESIPTRYLNLNTFKGLEVYVWEESGQMYCGLMSGTNANKTEAQIEALPPVSLDTMRRILETYQIPRESIDVRLHGTSQYWDKNTGYTKEYWEICQTLGVVSFGFDGVAAINLFYESNAQNLRVRINGTVCQYIATDQQSDDYQKDIWMREIERYKDYVITLWQVYSVENDPNYEILILVCDGKETVYVKQAES